MNFRIRFWFPLITAGMISWSAFSQTSKIDSLEAEYKLAIDDSVKFNILIELFKEANQNNRIDQLLGYTDRIETLAEKANNTNEIIKVKFSKAGVYFQRFYKMDTALFHLREGLALIDLTKPIKKTAPNRLDFWNVIGLIHKNKGEYDSAIFYYDKILSISGDYAWSRYYATLNVSNLYTILGNDQLALKYAHENYKIANELDPELVQNSRILIGRKYFSQGLYDKAIEVYDAAIEWYSQDYKKYETSINVTNGDKCASLHKLGRYSEAESLGEKVLAHELKIYGDNHINIARRYLFLFYIKMGLGKTEQSLVYLDKIQQIASEINNKDLIRQRYAALGEFWFLRKDFDQAIENYQIAISYYSSNFTNAGLNRKLGDVFLENQDYHGAIDSFHKAIRLRDTTGVLNAENITSAWYNAEAAMKIGLAYEKLNDQRKNESHLTQSLKYYYLADSLVSNIKGLYKQQDEEIDLSILFEDLYSGGVNVALKLHELTNKESYLQSAFYFSEKDKSSVLLSSTIQAKPVFLGLPDSVVELESGLKSKIEYYQKRLANPRTKESDARRFEVLITQYQSDRDNLHFHLEQDYPEYYRLRFNPDYLSLDEINDKLERDESIVSYNYLGDSLAVFVIGNDEAKLVTFPISESIDSLITQFNRSLKDRFSEDYLRYGRELYEFVFKPISPYIKSKEIVIIPDGLLWHINFDLLITSHEEQRFLLQDKAISYANSANQFVRLKFKNLVNQECLAFSYNEEDEFAEGQNVNLSVVRNSLSDLPGTSKEIKNVSTILTGNYLYGSKATERNFKELAGDYSILHLALHGEINDSIPNHSKLFFAKNDADTTEDSFLHAFELYGMNLNADMVVLSACNTGVGKLVGGEGFMSLGRAFQYAGTNSVLLSNWEVVDGAAPELMKSFYMYLKQGKSKSEALRLSKIDFLKNAEVLKSHPYYWGTFTLMGSNASIEGKWYEKYMVQIVLVLLTIAALTLWRIYRTRPFASR